MEIIGILQKATDAKENTDNAQIRERIQLAYHSALTGGQGSYTKDTLMQELKNEFESDYDVDDSDDDNWTLYAQGQSVTIPAGKKIIVWSLASEIFDEDETVQEKMHIGDYVNYPIYYDNATINNASWVGAAQSHYTCWRVIGNDEDGDNKSVMLVTAGVPMSFYLNTYNVIPPNLKSNVKFFQTEINKYGYNNNFKSCGFRNDKTAGTNIDTISDLCNIFNNKYTQKLNDVPRVRIFNKNDIINVNGTANSNQFVSTHNMLLNVPSNKSEDYTPIWLGGGSRWDLIQTNGYLTSGEENECGIRLVVYLKSNVKYSLSSESHSTDSQKIWNID